VAAGAGVAGADQLHDVAHDPREVEVLGGVDGGHTGLLERRDVLLGDDPAHDHGRLYAGLAQRVDHRGDQLAVRAGEDRQADHVHALLEGRGGDLGGGQADAFVDHVHPRVPGAYRDLLGAV
jgi:hypothetical protein